MLKLLDKERLSHIDEFNCDEEADRGTHPENEVERRVLADEGNLLIDPLVAS